MFCCCEKIFCCSTLLEWLTFGATVLGGLFALIKWRKDVSVKRLEELQKLLLSIRQDDDMKLAIYKLDDYSEKWFNENFPDSKDVIPIDKLLFHFCSILYLKKDFIGENEFRSLSFEFENVLLNPQVQDYLYNLQMYSKEKKINNPFEVLIKYGLDRELLDAQFVEITGCSSKNYKRGKTFVFHDFYKEWLKEEQNNAKDNY